MQDPIFATFAGNEEEAHQATVLVESIRAFGGRFHAAPVWVYSTTGAIGEAAGENLSSHGAVLRDCVTPEPARWFYFAGKPYAAGAAEAAADGKVDLLLWMDCDTIVLHEPGSLILDGEQCLGATPVFHKRIGSPLVGPPDPFWRRVYDLLDVPESSVFPVETPVDRAVLRAYFNCGLLVVRPERAILRRWARCFETLRGDAALVEMCRSDERKRVFLHQVALAGAILNLMKREKILLYPRGINYNYYLQTLYPDETRLDSLDDVVTLRYDLAFRDPDVVRSLRGSENIVSWIRSRFTPERYPWRK